MVFVTAGLGGGTGTGAAPVIASLSKELGALTVAVVTKPFAFEGPRRMRLADEGLASLASMVDTVIAIPNDRLLTLVPRGTSFFEAFKAADDLLRQAVEGMRDIIVTPGRDQPRFRRHQGHHGGNGLRHDGDGGGARRERGGGSGAPGDQLPDARGLAHRRVARHPDQYHGVQPVGIARGPRSLLHHSRGGRVRRRADQLRRDPERIDGGRGEADGDRHGLPAGAGAGARAAPPERRGPGGPRARARAGPRARAGGRGVARAQRRRPSRNRWFPRPSPRTHPCRRR